MNLRLTNSQKSLYYASELYGPKYPINIGGIMNFKNAISKSEIYDALKKLVEICPNLRTTIDNDNEFPQKINETIEFIVDEFNDLNKKDLNNYFLNPFNSKERLFRFGFIESTNSLIFVVSHLVSDGYSFKLMNELLYNILTKKPFESYPNIEHQLLYESSDSYVKNNFKSTDYFKRTLTDNYVSIKPYFKSNKLEKTNILKTKLQIDNNNLLNDFLGLNNHSFQSILAALIGIELSISNSTNLVNIGITLHNRTKSNKNVLGLISQTFPLSFIVEKSFLETLNNVKKNTVSLYRNKTIKYEDILKLKKCEMFSVLLNVQEKVLDNTFVDYEIIYDEYSDIDLIINTYYDHFNNEYSFVYISKSSLFTKVELVNLHERLTKRIKLILNGIDNINDLSIQKIIKKNSNISNVKILDILNNVFNKNKNKIALKENDNSINYNELDKASNKIASKIKLLNINEQIILINNKSDIDKIISILAIIKSNNTFTFLPNDELLSSKVLVQLNVTLVIDDDFINDDNINYINSFNRTTNRLAIYHTSGTTSKYKSIILSDEGIINYCLQDNNYQKELEIYNTLLNLANFNFDIALENIFLSLIHGKTLILSDLTNVFNIEERIDFLSTTPSVFTFLESNKLTLLKNLKSLVLGGEVLTDALAKTIKTKYDFNLYNSYGPSEASIAVTTKLVTNKVTLGKPIKGVNIAILNDFNQFLDDGYIGNIAISGVALALGYLNNKTFAKKINNIDYFLTNDLGYINDDSELVYLTRLDNQIKRNGVRIELDYIDKILSDHQFITKSKTIFKDNKLISYVESNSLLKTDIRNYLKELLPSNFLPNEIILTNDFELSNSGKLALNTNHQILKSNNEIENIIYDNIKRILNINTIYTNNTFISVGGDSITFLTLIVTLNELNISLNLEVFSNDILIKDYSKFLIDYNYNNIKKVDNINFYLDKTINNNKNVLLLGSTGFLGIHLLKELVKNDSLVTVIVRSKDEKNEYTRLNNLYNYYFNENIPKNIKIINGDLTKSYFGLDQVYYEAILSSIDIVINAAAKVDFIGELDDFIKINYNLVVKLEQESKKFNFHLFQISTTGMALLEDNFNETSYYNNDVYTNYYLQTKRMAEDYLLSKFNSNNFIYILRVGNLMPRSNDYKFQLNKENNLFYLMIRNNFKTTKIGKVDVSSVDLVSTAIIQVIMKTPKLRVLHIYNPNLVVIDEDYNYSVNNDLTVDILKQSNFVFPKVSKKYLKEVIKDFKK